MTHMRSRSIYDCPGLFVPKPSHRVRCQRCGVPDLGTTVRRCPLAFTAVGGDCYSLGYSVAREWGRGPRSDDHLDANYRRTRRPDNLGS